MCEMKLTVRLFGKFEVFCGNQRIMFSNRHGDEFLAFLLIQKKFVDKDTICGTLWPNKTKNTL